MVPEFQPNASINIGFISIYPGALWEGISQAVSLWQWGTRQRALTDRTFSSGKNQLRLRAQCKCPEREIEVPAISFSVIYLLLFFKTKIKNKLFMHISLTQDDSPWGWILTLVKFEYSSSSGLWRWISAQNARPSLKLKDNRQVTLMRITGYGKRRLKHGGRAQKRRASTPNVSAWVWQLRGTRVSAILLLEFVVKKTYWMYPLFP